jgi:hypothetical protein
MASWMTKDRDRMRQLCAIGETQTIGRPAGPKAKGHKTPKTGTLPYVRHSVGDRMGASATVGNAARAKDLRKARAKKIRAAKNSVSL